MRRYLVIANQTLGGETLLGKIRERTTDEPAEFYLLVPATSPMRLGADMQDESVRSHPETEPESLAWALAERRLAHELDRLHTNGIQAEGEVGAEDPMEAIGEVLSRRQFDEIIICSLPQHVSRWLAMDLPSRANRKFQLPVVHCTDQPTA